MMSLEINCLSGWNMTGLPLDMDNCGYLNLFDNAVENTLFSFGENGVYIQEEILTTGTGYWLRITDNYIQEFTGEPISEVTVNLIEEWNLISGISYSVDVNAIIDPDELLIPNAIYEYDEGGFVTASSLEPGKGYWVRSLGEGSIVITENSLIKKRDFINRLANAHTISFNGIPLHFGVEIPENEKLSYSLPPKPPQDAFDVRFKGDWTFYENSEEIEITGSDNDPISIAYDATKQGFCIANQSNTCKIENWILLNTNTNQEYVLSGQGEFTIANGKDRYILTKKQVFQYIPDSYELAENFPNPFNPVTTIRYNLPIQAHVNITVFSMLGKEIVKLVDSQLVAGSHSVVWNGIDMSGKEVSGGIYFYQINAGNFNQTRRMILLK